VFETKWGKAGLLICTSDILYLLTSRLGHVPPNCSPDFGRPRRGHHLRPYLLAGHRF
jgi:hypothetical protein